MKALAPSAIIIRTTIISSNDGRGFETTSVRKKERETAETTQLPSASSPPLSLKFTIVRPCLSARLEFDFIHCPNLNRHRTKLLARFVCTLNCHRVFTLNLVSALAGFSPAAAASAASASAYASKQTFASLPITSEVIWVSD